MWILIVGNPVDGFTYFGPYTSNEDVVEAGEQTSSGDWWITQLTAPEGDKVSDDDTEHDDFGFEDKPEVDENHPAYARGFSNGFSDGHKIGYEAAVRDGLKESNAKTTDRDNANYELGYSRGFNDGLSGTGPMYEPEPVNPHDSEQVAANLGFIGRKKPANELVELLREAADLLLEEGGYADHDLVPAKLYDMANKLEGK